MRVAKQFGVRTIIPKETKRKFFLVFEGEKTECQYFDGVNSNKAELNISALVEIKPLKRSTGHETTSNPKRITRYSQCQWRHWNGTSPWLHRTLSKRPDFIGLFINKIYGPYCGFDLRLR